MLSDWWRGQKLPDVEGIVDAGGRLHAPSGTGFLPTGSAPGSHGELDVDLLASRDLPFFGLRVECGEASAHGSIGVVVVRRLSDRSPLWALVSSRSNPFDQVEVKGPWVLVLSTSGAVLRFREGWQDARLWS